MEDEDLRKSALLRIHLLKRMTLELKEIHVLVIVSAILVCGEAGSGMRTRCRLRDGDQPLRAPTSLLKG